jgi:hypothetical protein
MSVGAFVDGCKNPRAVVEEIDRSASAAFLGSANCGVNM